MTGFKKLDREMLQRARDLPSPEGLKSKLSSPETACEACDGVGFVRLMLPLGHPGFGKRQNCDACNPVPETWGIPERLENATFESFDLKLNRGMKPALERCQKVASGNAWCAVLAGDIGTGKSHLAAAALRASLHPKPCLFWSWGSLLLWMRRQMFDDAGPQRPEAEVVGYYQENPALLVLDDLGAEKATEWVGQTLYGILNARYEAKLPTILTTNNFGVIDERIKSRYFEGIIACEGRDIRKKGVSMTNAPQEAGI